MRFSLRQHRVSLAWWGVCLAAFVVLSLVGCGGGGAGGCGAWSTQANMFSGGGGGGSSYVDPAATNRDIQQGVRSGHGMVRIRYCK